MMHRFAAVLELIADPDAERHRRLAYHLRSRLAPSITGDIPTGAQERSPHDADDLRRFPRQAEDSVGGCRDVPTDADGFVAWFEALRESGPGQGDRLFPWLAQAADETAMRWFLAQELAGEAGFDDLVALTLVRLPPRPKMEMARNLWDEFGRGNPEGVHGALLARMAVELALTCPMEAATSETLALANLMAGLAIERQVFHAVGALGIIEPTAPGRVACVAQGMRRHGMPASTRRDYELHATLDIEHSRRWNAEILHPLVAADPRIAPLLAQGALMRLEAGRRCFERYRLVLLPA